MSQFTLSIDCGGSFIKSYVLDESGTMHAAPNGVVVATPHYMNEVGVSGGVRAWQL